MSEFRVRYTKGGWCVERFDGKRLGLRKRNGRRVITWTDSETKVVTGSEAQATALVLALEGER